ncbi:hypothetical protein EMIHUDRAFT_423306 [Emiliania huxleyi CCMP1516]|uniref:Uncharacterized protein n=2 Tax=Emiliania huxleyi TaxID=2903 RepID=A0A0D3KKW4_EMIH1|nr:hypothetical protein EMIHUDRAFT_423306 [Emiliania huxleyi CCMP1516]EOD36399.1 hypothetical protein EMIHUDRAFT_423306 [Emiliania huxleyi CCMP1516]|eukprot:XP_005788828.1 hypothetical protein EMIHUDRAFT_423306 [Emiliania huxleyi CCMP1516]
MSSLRACLLLLLAYSTPTSSIKLGRAAPGEGLSRRGLLARSAALAALPAPLSALAAGVASDGTTVRGVNEGMPTGEKDVAKFLQQQGFPPLPKVNGLSPLVQYIGAAPPANIDGSKQKERAFDSTLLVKFLYPSGWLVETPTLTENGEAGKIAANNYLKGDFADFVAAKLPPGKTLESIDKAFLTTFLVSQMTADVYEDVKVGKVKRLTAADGMDVAYIDFGYTLLTRAGFTVDRKGTACVHVVGGAIVGLVTGTTGQRFKSLEADLRACTESFRAYAVKKPDFAFLNGAA